MRDVNRLRAREGLQVERSQIVWLTLGGIVALGLAFGMGFISGKRSERLAMQMSESPPSLVQLKDEAKRHRQLTFYSDLSQSKDNPSVDPKPEPKSEPTNAPPKTPVQQAAPAASAFVQQATAALGQGPARKGDYTIQVSSFQTMGEAKAYAGSLERKGFRPFIVAAEIRDKGTWYRVRLGRFSDEATAQAAKKILHKADTPAWVLKTE